MMEEVFKYIDKVYDMVKGYDKYELGEITNRMLYIRNRIGVLRDRIDNEDKVVKCNGF